MSQDANWFSTQISRRKRPQRHIDSQQYSKMTSFQVWTILSAVLNIVVCQNLGRIVTNSVKDCTGEIKDYIGAQAGDRVTIHYTGWLRAESAGNAWRKGKQFDSSKGGKPISFELGKGVVVKGWDDGLIGTCEGESLRLEIPSEFAYGDQGT